MVVPIIGTVPTHTRKHIVDQQSSDYQKYPHGRPYFDLRTHARRRQGQPGHESNEAGNKQNKSIRPGFPTTFTTQLHCANPFSGYQ
jgi:hypothetical protein